MEKGYAIALYLSLFPSEKIAKVFEKANSRPYISFKSEHVCGVCRSIDLGLYFFAWHWL